MQGKHYHQYQQLLYLFRIYMVSAIIFGYRVQSFSQESINLKKCDPNLSLSRRKSSHFFLKSSNLRSEWRDEGFSSFVLSPFFSPSILICLSLSIQFFFFCIFSGQIRIDNQFETFQQISTTTRLNREMLSCRSSRPPKMVSTRVMYSPHGEALEVCRSFETFSIAFSYHEPHLRDVQPPIFTFTKKGTDWSGVQSARIGKVLAGEVCGLLRSVVFFCLWSAPFSLRVLTQIRR